MHEVVRGMAFNALFDNGFSLNTGWCLERFSNNRSNNVFDFRLI